MLRLGASVAFASRPGQCFDIWPSEGLSRFRTSQIVVPRQIRRCGQSSRDPLRLRDTDYSKRFFRFLMFCLLIIF